MTPLRAADAAMELFDRRVLHEWLVPATRSTEIPGIIRQYRTEDL
jgi:hypothetical protein